MDCIWQTSRTARRGGAVTWLFVALLLGAAVTVLVWSLSPGEERSGAFVQADFERRVGVEAARIVEELGGPNKALTVGILRLSTRDTGPQSEGYRALVGALAARSHAVKTYDPVSLELGDDAPYTSCLGALIADCSPDIVVALVRGRIEKAPVTAAMKEFIGRGGRLIFIGEILKPESSVVDLIRKGGAVAVAKNTGALRGRAPASRTLKASDPDEYLKLYHTILTKKNVGEVLGGREGPRPDALK